MATKKNTKDKVSLKGTSGNDSIKNGGYWDGYFYKGGSNVTIDGGAGNDTIGNDGGDNVSINAGAGNDEIYNNCAEVGSSVTIDAGADNDYIYNSGSSVTIDGGKGNDSIENENGKNVLFVYSGGNDSISGFRSDSTIKIATGTMNSVINSNGVDLFLSVGNSTITLEGAARYADKLNIVNSKGKAVKYSVKPNFNFTKGNDSVTNYLNNVTLKALGGNDYIGNYGSKVTIDGGADNDTIENRGGPNVSISGGAGNDKIYNNIVSSIDDEETFSLDSVTINAGAGNDYIYNNGSKVTIDGGADNDTIKNSGGSNVSINGGAGNDTIYNNTVSGEFGDEMFFPDETFSPDSVTINGGAGNDYIKNDGAKVVFNYASGDGNDSIYGFKADSTLSIAGGSYSTTKSGNNIIVSVGKGKVTLNGASSLSAVHINNDIILTDKTKTPVTVESAIKTIDASTRTKAIKITGNSKANIIFGGKGNDSLWGGKGNDSLYGGDGKDVFIYKPGEGTDTIFDYASGDMLKILKSDGKEGGTFTSSSFKSNTLTLAIDGGGKVVFDNVSSSDKFNINGTTYKISGTKLK